MESAMAYSTSGTSTDLPGEGVTSQPLGESSVDAGPQPEISPGVQAVSSSTESAPEHTLNMEVTTAINADQREVTPTAERTSMRTWRQTNVMARVSISDLPLPHQATLSAEADPEMEKQYLKGVSPEQAEIERRLREREMAPVSCLSISVFNDVWTFSQVAERFTGLLISDGTGDRVSPIMRPIVESSTASVVEQSAEIQEEETGNASLEGVAEGDTTLVSLLRGESTEWGLILIASSGRDRGSGRRVEAQQRIEEER
jgi:hypothetical protein